MLLCNCGRKPLEEISRQGMTEPPRNCHRQLTDMAYVGPRAEEHKRSLVDAKTRKEENVISRCHVMLKPPARRTICPGSGLAFPVNQLAIDRVVAIARRWRELP